MKRTTLLALGMLFALGLATPAAAQDASSWAYIAGADDRVIVQDFMIERDTLWLVTPKELIALTAKIDVGHKPVVWPGPPNWSLLVLATAESVLSVIGPTEAMSASALLRVQTSVESALRRNNAPFQWVKAMSASYLEVRWTGMKKDDPPEKFSVMSGYPSADEILLGRLEHLRAMQQRGCGFVITANSTSYPDQSDSVSVENEVQQLRQYRMAPVEEQRQFLRSWRGVFIKQPLAMDFLHPRMLVREPR